MPLAESGFSGDIDMPLVRIHRKGQMTLPTGGCTAVGLADGDVVDVKVSGRRIIVTPTLIIDHSTTSDDETPAQRRVIDAQLAVGLEDIRKGRVSPRIDTAGELLASLKASPRTASRRRGTTRSG